MNVSRTMAPNRTIITHRYAVTTGNDSFCTFFMGYSFSRDALLRYGVSGPPQALYRPGHRPGYRAHHRAGHEAAEEGGDAEHGLLHAGSEHALQVAAEARHVAAERRAPEHLAGYREHHGVGEADDR